MARVRIVAGLAMLVLGCNSILGIRDLPLRTDGGASRGQTGGGAGMATGDGGGDGGAPPGSTGGTTGGGTGGSTGAGSGGSPVTGAGGTSGSGGTPGAGGKTGTGGATGAGGAPGTGGTTRVDAGPVNCTQLADSYRTSIVNSKPCGGGGLTCDNPRPTALCSGACTTFISVTTQVDKIRDDWMAGNCAATAPPCTGTDVCATPPSSGYCMADGLSSSGFCKDTPPGP